MKKYLIGFILVLTLFSCKKDDSQKDYSSFLKQSSQRFQGILDKSYFSMNYGGSSEYQNSEGFENGNGVCDSADPVRVVLFGLAVASNAKPSFVLYSPKFNTTSESEISQVFSKGIKKLGDYRTDFYLRINWGNNLYQSNSFNKSNEIEILKTVEFIDNISKMQTIRVWFRLDAELSTCSCENNTSVLSNGLMIAEFIGFRKGK
jgi:hypothetical protein